MSKHTDIQPSGAALYFLPVKTRVPLKFGAESLTQVTCARVALHVEDRRGKEATGWGETPLNVQWVWPSRLSYAERHKAMREFCVTLSHAWAGFDCSGHPLEVGNSFTEEELPLLLEDFNEERGGEPMPWLAAMVCSSAFDIALHDAYGQMHGVATYETYNRDWMNWDLADFLNPAPGTEISFEDRYPADYFLHPRPATLPVWHLVGGADPLEAGDEGDAGPDDGHPRLLREWIRRDGLRCLKVKLRGNDAAWDRERLSRVGSIALEEGVEHLSADFNCMVREPVYVNEILDWLNAEYPSILEALLYVEQPFPYDLESHPIDVSSVTRRKPLFLDESAHDWRMVRLGRELGWNGVALKTCKTQTGALLSLCWAKAHGMSLMVQDLTNPMLAQISHLQLAAHTPTIMGVESNAMQFYPDASQPEAKVHPGLYTRKNGLLDLSSIAPTGLGYGAAVKCRPLPKPACEIEQ